MQARADHQRHAASNAAQRLDVVGCRHRHAVRRRDNDGAGPSQWVQATAVPFLDTSTFIKVVRLRIITASTTYTPHANMLYCVIEAVGGGGGGGGVTGSAIHSLYAGGGGSGGYSRSVKTTTNIGA